jgi:hypothetical protein
MHDQNQSNHPPDALTQGFWQAWREQVGKTPRLAHLLLQRGRHLLERFQHVHTALSRLSRPAQVRWQRKLGASLAGVALALALSGAPSVQAFPVGPEVHINGTDCFLVDAITAANTDTATGDCAAGNPGADTITLLSDVYLYSVNSGSSASVNGLPLITSAITIEGAGFAIARDAGAPNFRILAVEPGGDLTLNATTITGGSFAGGANGAGILNRGALTLNNSTVSGNSISGNNSGGGIYSGFGSTLTLANSTISGNSAAAAGGLFTAGPATLSNSTVSGNTASGSGGGIYNFGTLTLERSLITGNTAPSAQEIQNYDGFSPGTINSNNFNLFGHSGESNAQAFYSFTPGGSDIIATSDGTTPTALAAILAPLAVDSGALVHALVTGSPAIDAAPSGPATDQRGVSRPQGAAFDIGAFELEQAAAPANARINGTDCDLIDAITAANTDTATGACAAGTPGADTIDLLDNVTLSSAIGTVGTPSITSIITLNGNGFTIARDAGAPNFGILAVAAGGDLTLNATIITGGSFFPGAGINNALGGTLTLNNSTVSGNHADPGSNRGGGIRNSGTATLNHSAVSGNSAQFGGGIDNDGGVLTLINSTISGNTALIGGGISTTTNFNGNVTLNNSTVSENTTINGGAGITVLAGTLTLNNSTVSGNTTNGQGGGINTQFASQTVVTLNNSTVSGNSATSGGGIRRTVGNVILNNSIVANQVAGGDCFGTITSAGYNLDSDGSCGLTGAGDIPNGFANLGPLQINAPGNTATHALVTGSQAIDAATSGLATDQRGVSRPQGCGFDMGAFELEQAPCVVNEPPIANAGPDQSVFRNDVVTVSGTWTDPDEASDNPYTWSWDLTGDTLVDDSGSANYGDTIVRTTSFAVDGVATLTFSVTDKDGATGSDTVEITVINRAPTANDQSVSTDEDTPLPITLTGGDADNDTLVYTVLTMPANGTLSGTAPNLTYTPAPNYFGPDSFTFKVNDGLADSAVATVSINVISVNDPPVAVDDTATTLKNVPVTIAVQVNDSAGPANEDQTLTTTAVTAPANGAAVINPDGSVTYTPNFNFFGIDSFAYTVCDSDGACATATVTVLVEWTNAPPTAVDDSATTNEDTPVTIDAVANDSDVDGNLNPASAAVVSGPTNGTVVNNGNGSFTYTPNANFSGTDSFVYEVCDSDGVCATATVTITVIQVNNAPVCTSVTPSVSVLWPPNHQWEPITVSGVTDIDGDSITIAITSIFQDEPTNGTGDGDTSPDGQGIGSSTAQVRAERAGGGNGRYYHISFSASDGQGGSCTGLVKVSVPKNQGKNGAAVDDGPLYNSTLP